MELWLAAPTPWRREPLLHRQRGRLYPHPDTVKGLMRWRQAWMAQGRWVVHGPVAVSMSIIIPRPVSHLRRDGTLSAAGARVPYPKGRPDVDNMAKMALDALKGHAFDDDAAVIRLWVWKRYPEPGERPGCTLRAFSLPVPSAEPPPALQLEHPGTRPGTTEARR